jgi:hypothetical protein
MPKRSVSWFALPHLPRLITTSIVSDYQKRLTALFDFDNQFS